MWKNRKLRHIRWNHRTQDTVGESASTDTCRKRANGAAAATLRPNQARRNGNNTRGRNTHATKPKRSGRSKNPERKPSLEIGKQQDIPEQSLQPQYGDTTMELPYKANINLWTAHKGTATQPARQIGNLHVQPPTDDDEPTMGRRCLTPGKSSPARISGNRRWNNGSTRHRLWRWSHKRRTPKRYTRNDAKKCKYKEISTSAVETAEPNHPGASTTTDTMHQQKKTRDIYRAGRKDRDNASRSQTSRNARSTWTLSRCSKTSGRDNARVLTMAEHQRTEHAGNRTSKKVHMLKLKQRSQYANCKDEPPQKIPGMPSITSKRNPRGEIPRVPSNFHIANRHTATQTIYICADMRRNIPTQEMPTRKWRTTWRRNRKKKINRRPHMNKEQ